MKKFIIIVLIFIIVVVLGSIIYWQIKVNTKNTVNEEVNAENNKPVITLVSPNGGETLEEGSTYTIKWETQNISMTNKISISIRRVAPPPLPSEGQEFDPIVFVGLENTGSKDWNISNMYPEGNYILGITSYVSLPITDEAVSDESNAIFNIVKNSGLQTYANKELGYSIDYPTNWTFREFPDTQSGAGFRPLSSLDDIASECINIDARGAAENEYNIAFNAYVKKAAVSEIQNYEKLNSIESILTTDGLTGYKTTWIYKSMDGQEKTSLPITYFENKKTIQEKDSQLKYKTVQVILNDLSCEKVYNQMLSTFKLLK